MHQKPLSNAPNTVFCFLRAASFRQKGEKAEYLLLATVLTEQLHTAHSQGEKDLQHKLKRNLDSKASPSSKYSQSKLGAEKWTVSEIRDCFY